MKNIGNMMKQAQQMQQRMMDMQARLGEMEQEGQAGGGLVSVTLSGKGEAKRVKLDKSVVDPNDIEMLEDLVTAAINDARHKIDAVTAAETEKAMGGMGLPPGLKLPF
jgi:DNA-binding YbaB/EbfC family protein